MKPHVTNLSPGSRAVPIGTRVNKLVNLDLQPPVMQTGGGGGRVAQTLDCRTTTMPPTSYEQGRMAERTPQPA